MTTKGLSTTTKLPTTTERSYPMQWPTKARCVCRPGLLRNTDGKCVNATGCQPSNISSINFRIKSNNCILACEANQIWDPCGFEKTDRCNPIPVRIIPYSLF